MKLLFLICITTTVVSSFASVKTNWQYSSFEFLSINSKLRTNEPSKVIIFNKKFTPLISKKAATHRLWGVDQIYSNSDSKERVFIKYNTQVKGSAPVGVWKKIGNGHITHLKQPNGKLTAIYAQGLNIKELNSFKLNFERRRKSASINSNWFINCAYAETTRSRGARANFPTDDSVSQIDNSNFLYRAGNMVSCVGAEALDNTMERAQSLWEGATWENIKSMAGTAWDAVPAKEEVARGAATAGRWTWDRVSEPAETWNRISNSYDRTREVLASVYAQVSESMVGFRDLPQDMQDEIVCHITAQIAAEGVLGVAIGVTGVGATVAVARLLNRVRSITSELAAKMPKIRSVTERPASERRNATREILSQQKNPNNRTAAIASRSPQAPKSISEKPVGYPERNSGKPFSNFDRSQGVPDDYSPVEFSTNRVIEKSGTAPHIHPLDPNDVEGGFSSFLGPVEVNKNGRPLNPKYYTGLTGRGTLYKWGSNFAADAVVTRRNTENGKIEMLLIQRKDTSEWAFPGGFVDEGELAAKAVVRELAEESSVNLDIKGARMVYRGYVDDPRTTDNAWIETTAMHWHVGDRNIKAIAGDDAKSVKWVEVDESTLANMYASHGEIALKALRGLNP